MYNQTDESKYSLEDCKKAIGTKVTLKLTGTIVEAREGPSGAFVFFSPDKRWGFGNGRLGIDLDAFNEYSTPKEEKE